MIWQVRSDQMDTQPLHNRRNRSRTNNDSVKVPLFFPGRSKRTHVEIGWALGYTP